MPQGIVKPDYVETLKWPAATRAYIDRLENELEAASAQRDALLLENASYRAIVDSPSLEGVLRLIHRQMRLWAKEAFDANPDSDLTEPARYFEERQKMVLALMHTAFDGPDMDRIEAAIQEAQP